MSSLLCSARIVDALRDVGRLRPDRDGDAALVAVEADLGRVVADLDDLVAHERGDLDVTLRGDLTGDVYETCRDQCLDRDAAVRVDGEEGIQDAVGDLVANLVRVTLGDRFGREKAQICHGSPSSGMTRKIR
jgi:hypothetical protein